MRFLNISAAIMSTVIILTSGCGETPSKDKHPDYNATPKELESIKVRITMDERIKKDGKQKFIVDVVNDSEMKFTGNIHITSDDVSFVDAPDMDVVLQPGQKNSMFSFGEKVNYSSKFNIRKTGKFEKVEFKKIAKVPPYKVVKKRVGEAYATIWVETSHTDDNSIILISREMYDNHKNDYRIGFQVRFVDPKVGVSDSTCLAVFAQSKMPSNSFAHVISFANGEEKELANFK